MEITAKDILPFQFYTYKQPFTGSCQGMRYRIVQKEEDAKAYFEVSVWGAPYAYEHTPPEEIEKQTFPFDTEGYQRVLAWLNEKRGEYQ